MCNKGTDLMRILIAWNAVSLTAYEYLSTVQQLHLLFWEICLLELPVFPLGLLSETTYVKCFSQLDMCVALDIQLHNLL